MKVQTVDVAVRRAANEVYAYANRPERMPLWASGLASGLEPAGDHWIATGALGTVKVVFTPPNDLGVMDHAVTMESGKTVYNAFRVMPNGNAAVLMFTVVQQPGTDDATFLRDVEWVRDDLHRLRDILEAS